MPLKNAVEKFFRKYGKQIQADLNIKRARRGDGVRSLLNAVRRGRKESRSVNENRRGNWRILRGGFRSRLVADPAMAAYLQAAAQYPLLVESQFNSLF